MKLTVNNLQCHFRRGNLPFDSSCPTIVLIHGAANDSDVWQKILTTLCQSGYAVMAPDLPGHGLSDGKPLQNIEALADWVIALLDAAGIDKAILVGHSMGALIALEAAARNPRRIGRLALLGATTPMAVSEALLKAAKNDPDRAYRTITDYSHTRQFYLTGSGGHGVWGPGITLGIMRRSRDGVLKTDLENCNGYLHGLEAAERVECPTLVIVAMRDRMAPRRNTLALLSALRHGTRSDIAACGHAMMNEKPGEVVSALVSFLAT